MPLFVNKVLRDWLKTTTVEQRKNFINIIYEVLITLVDTAVLYTVNNGGVIVLASVFSIVFFKEKIQHHKLLGILIAIISIILLTITV